MYRLSATHTHAHHIRDNCVVSALLQERWMSYLDVKEAPKLLLGSSI